MQEGGRALVGLIVAVALTVAACSADGSAEPALAPSPDLTHDPADLPEPEIFQSGTVAWGAADDERFRYEISEVLGFAASVTVRASSETKVSVRSANRVGNDDVLWLNVLIFADNAPALVFGGTDPGVGVITLVGVAGEELTVQPAELAGRDWLLVAQELPSSWTVDDQVELEVVARDGTDVVAREQLSEQRAASVAVDDPESS